MTDRFDIEQVIKILGLEIRADQADDGRDFDVTCRIALEKLRKCKEYEDVEEQGLLKKLPCKVGDKFYVIAYSDRKVTHVRCSGYCIQIDSVNNINQSYIWIDSLENSKDYWKIPFDDFKIQCFKTQEEAEDKLDEMSK